MSGPYTRTHEMSGPYTRTYEKHVCAHKAHSSGPTKPNRAEPSSSDRDLVPSPNTGLSGQFDVSAPFLSCGDQQHECKRLIPKKTIETQDKDSKSTVYTEPSHHPRASSSRRLPRNHQCQIQLGAGGDWTIDTQGNVLPSPQIRHDWPIRFTGLSSGLDLLWRWVRAPGDGSWHLEPSLAGNHCPIMSSLVQTTLDFLHPWG